ncbi:bifunctional precorrin-2 dehydrogenase/sirohydrochlorin ferrochelatase [uncultured Draconibacterium sp.]|uniref:precorrin-2 dehydrogenase/sirohydrochlorin ferrochelatase family protein n=1 Tax=uncultured Draconibacterium sp. TaxID=1573823 RepID=UPI0025F661CC|nr:bifunctional precorrin-2 dehydrogenase/sirohydrochlorin ferrochelatase [uncultured Draconibacterium sp.]
MANKNFLPIAIDIANQKILIVGGGQSAFNKLQILHRHNAKVEILATEVCDEIKNSGVKYIEKPYDKKYIKDYLMLYSCTNNDEVDRQIEEDCRAAKVLVNIHDKPERCQFVSPAIYRTGNISVAVSSNGENVYESIRIRNLIQDKLQLN